MQPTLAEGFSVTVTQHHISTWRKKYIINSSILRRISMPKGLNWCSNAPKVISRSGSSRDTPTPCPLPWMVSLSSREAVLLELGSSYPPAALWRRSHWTPAWPLLPPSCQKLWAPKADLICCGGGPLMLGEVDRGARSIQSSEKKSRQTPRKLQHGGENGSELL